MSGLKPGLQAYTYKFDGTLASPTNLTLIKIVRDESVDFDRGSIDGSSRQSKFRSKVPGLIEGDIETQILHLPGDAVFDAIQQAFFDGTKVGMAFVDGPLQAGDQQHGETGTIDVVGLWGSFYVTNFSEQRALEEAMVHDVRFSNTLENTTNAPPIYKKETVNLNPGP